MTSLRESCPACRSSLAASCVRLPKKHGGSEVKLLVQYLCDSHTGLISEALDESDDVSAEMGVRRGTIRHEEHPELAERLRTAASEDR